MSADKGGGGVTLGVLEAEFRACQASCGRARKEHCPQMVELKIREALDKALNAKLTMFALAIAVINAAINYFSYFKH